MIQYILVGQGAEAGSGGTRDWPSKDGTEEKPRPREQAVRDRSANRGILQPT